MALASEDTRPLVKAIVKTMPRPATAQWGVFLRNHDELDLGRLSESSARLFLMRLGQTATINSTVVASGVGLLRCWQVIENVSSLRTVLLFSLPGTPVIRYGDELGMGDDPLITGTGILSNAHAMVDRTAWRLHEE